MREDFEKTFYTIFRIIIGDPYDYFDMISIEPIATTFLCVSFAVIVALIFLNFFIGLITSVLNVEAFHEVEKHGFMEKLKFGLHAEWRTPYNRRILYYEKIASDRAKIIDLNELNEPNIDVFKIQNEVETSKF